MTKRRGGGDLEVAIPLDWPVPWDIGAPVPHVVASRRATFLIYLVNTARFSSAGYDHSELRVIDPASDDVQRLALVTFADCNALRFGRPNEEPISVHPLYGHGLEAFRAHSVENSRWLAACQSIDSFRADDDPARWDNHRHDLLTFHDELFECLATGFAIEVYDASFGDVLQMAQNRL